MYFSNPLSASGIEWCSSNHILESYRLQSDFFFLIGKQWIKDCPTKGMQPRSHDDKSQTTYSFIMSGSNYLVCGRFWRIGT